MKAAPEPVENHHDGSDIITDMEEAEKMSSGSSEKQEADLSFADDHGELVAVSVKARVLNFVQSYLEQTTVHGFKYVVTAVSPVERIAWMCFVALAFFAAFVMIGIYAYEAITNPITISLSTIPVAQVPFPAVSVDSGKSWDPMGYPRKDLARTLPDKSKEGMKGTNALTSCSIVDSPENDLQKSSG